MAVKFASKMHWCKYRECERGKARSGYYKQKTFLATHALVIFKRVFLSVRQSIYKEFQPPENELQLLN